MLLTAVLVVAGFAWYIMSPSERAKAVRTVIAVARRLQDTARNGRSTTAPFDAALRERTPNVIVTPALVALNAVTFAAMLFGSSPVSNPDTLIAWGGSFGPSTSNGEWWRLVTSMFVHAGILSLLVNVVGFTQIGLLLERLTGPVALAGVYLGAGVFAGLVNLSMHPVTVHAGAAASVLGVYGLLVASIVWSLLNRVDTALPPDTLKRLAPAAIVFILYVLAGGLERGPAVVAFATGLAGGLVLTRGIGERKPPVRRLAATVAGTMAIAVAAAVPLRGMAFVKPEIERLVDVEHRTAGAYEKSVAQFRLGRIKADALAQVIERSIVPELRAASARLTALDRVPREQQRLVADAVEYLRLREESWQLRVRALRTSSMATLRDADRREFASLQAFRRIAPEDSK